MSKQRAVSILARVKRCRSMNEVRSVLASVETQEAQIISSASRKKRAAARRLLVKTLGDWDSLLLTRSKQQALIDMMLEFANE